MTNNFEDLENNREEGESPEADEVSRQLRQIAEEADKPKDSQKEGFIRRTIGERVQRTVNESVLPNEEYESTVGVYGGKMDFDQEGKMVWDRRGVISKIDKAGDAVLRTFDDHVVREPFKLMRRHPRIAMRKVLSPGAKRYRGNNEEVEENIERLGLAEYYGPHENGIEIRKPEVYTHGIALQDVYRSDMIDSEKLKTTDRFQALAEAAKYVKDIHDKHGGVGELLVSDIIFQEDENGRLAKPVLNLPDIIFNKNKITSEGDKKTTDMLDFLCSVFGEELRRSQNAEEVDRALDAIIDNYGDRNMASMVKSFIKRGRLTLQGDTETLSLPDTSTKKARGIFSQHNKARLGLKKSTEGLMKEKITEACERFLSK